jgi:hypothetical protein
MNRAGCTMVGTSRLFGPCSITRIDSSGSASARRPAMTQAAVPPRRPEDVNHQYHGAWTMTLTSSKNHIHLRQSLGKMLEYRSHGTSQQQEDRKKPSRFAEPFETRSARLVCRALGAVPQFRSATRGRLQEVHDDGNNRLLCWDRQWSIVKVLSVCRSIFNTRSDLLLRHSYIRRYRSLMQRYPVDICPCCATSAACTQYSLSLLTFTDEKSTTVPRGRFLTCTGSHCMRFGQ